MAETRSEAMKTKHVQFSRDHIHRGIAYKPGDEADLFVAEADSLIKDGACGEQRAQPSFVKETPKG